MRPRIHRLTPLLLATLCVFQSHATESIASQPVSLEQALKNFAIAPESPSASTEDENDTLRFTNAAFTEWRKTQSQLTDIQNYFLNNDYATALRQARQYARQATTPQILKRWNDLIEALEADQKKAEGLLVAKVEALLDRVGAQLQESRLPAQLDPLLRELAAAQEHRGTASTRSQSLFNRLNTAVVIVQRWQEMLVFLETGETGNARQSLRGIAEAARAESPLKRDQILAYGAELNLIDASLVDAMRRIDPVIEASAKSALAAKTPTELEPSLNALNALRAENQSSGDDRMLPVGERIDKNLQFLRAWQRFLLAVHERDIRAARLHINEIESNRSFSQTEITPEQRLARANALLAEIGGDTNSLLSGANWDNLPALRDFFHQEQQDANGRRSVLLERIVSELDYLIAARGRLDQGEPELGLAFLRPGKIRDTYYSASALPIHPRLTALKNLWLFEAIPALTGLSDLAAPLDEESAITYTRRHLDAAIRAADWPRAHSLALLEVALLPADIPRSGAREQSTGADPAAAIAAWLLAEKLASVNQLPAAARACRDALEAGAPPALETLILARLQTLPANL